MTQARVREVYLTKTRNRNVGIRSLLGRFDLNDYSGRSVALKANFNSSDPFPASTHLDTLEVLVKVLNEVKVSGVTLVERSGMGDTRKVLEQTGVVELSEKLEFTVVVLDEVDKGE